MCGPMARKVLPPDEIAKRLPSLRAWSLNGDRLERSWTFPDFAEALAFINRVGVLAETADHHPDIHNSWNRVTLSLTTHDLGGLTEWDFELAKKIDAIH